MKKVAEYAEQLPKVGIFIRFYCELLNNIEGIEAISHIPDRIHSMHDEIIVFRNQLRFY